MPGCGRDAVESTGLTGLGIQPASSALRGLSSGRRGMLLCRGKHNTCSKDTNIQSKDQSLDIAQRHLLRAPKKSGVCTMVLHIPFTLLSPSTKPRHSSSFLTTGMEPRSEPLATTNIFFNCLKLGIPNCWAPLRVWV